MIINLNKSDVFFTSDLHIFHKNIIEYSKRPYKDLYSMHNHFLYLFKKYVKKDDYLINLGDLGMAAPEKLLDFYKQIEAIQIFVTGNHDRNGMINKFLTEFPIIFKDKTVLYIKYNNKNYTVYISHKPNEFEYIDDPYTLFLYGHMHEKELENKKWNQLNVGIDRFGRPISLREIIKIMKHENNA